MTIRVLVADDQDLVRTGLRLILGTLEGIEVVGEARDGQEAVRLARELRPDVCLMDIRMPVLDGVEATRQLAGPTVEDPIAVVVITTFDLDEYVHGALQAGPGSHPGRLAHLAEHHPPASVVVRTHRPRGTSEAADRPAQRPRGAGAAHPRPGPHQRRDCR